MSAPGLFVTGTNTEVGKTYVASLIARELAQQGVGVGVYKPVESGFTDQGGAADSQQLWEAANRPGLRDRVCPQRFRAPLAPHLAARQEDCEVDARLLCEGVVYWQQQSELVLVEGAGGLLSPVSDDEYAADIAATIGYPLIVVAANQLGVINQTLQTLLAARHYRLRVAAVVLNDCQLAPGDASLELNFSELRSRCDAPVLRLRYAAERCDEDVDWSGFAAAPAGVR